ncbi:MAG: molybdopterin-guanine dinucleotide biosynthesis protein B [Candidatus Acidulodesulfobacterium sp.]
MVKTKNGKIPAVVSFLARSGTGKTTLIEKIIKILSEKGYKVSSIKHTDHNVSADTEGKDSWRHKNAGAFSTMLISKEKISFFSDIEPSADIAIDSLISNFFKGSDILIVEGFKELGLKKIELARKDAGGLELRFKNDPNLILVCADEQISGLNVPQININDAEKISSFVEEKIILPNSDIDI